ncbi:MAG: Na/Pi symporter [Desulfurivibrio sp.]|nr:Na/Pi symporter [Desulfurivibrio sp.]
MGIFEHLDIWRLLAGLGIFLFGMFMLEESIKLLAGRAFKRLIRRCTGSRLRGIFSGMISTAILQSSTAVSLMVLAFVGAGMMSLVNAVAVMNGAMVGTTMTAWIVALFGFKVEISSFALPIIALGGLGLVLLSRSPRYVNISKLLVAFGLLFHGLDFMKGSVEELAATIDIAALPAPGLWVYALAGLLFTAIMQSSSVTIAITLTLLYNGVVDFNAAAAMVVGANVGTTVTVLLGSLGGAPIKKQAAVSQLAFTAGTALVTFLLLPLLLHLVLEILGFAARPVLGLAFFHTMFNLLGVAIFYHLLPPLTAGVRRLIPDPERLHLARYINNTTPEVPEAAVEALRKETINQAKWSLDFIRLLYRLDSGSPDRQPLAYSDLERLHAKIFTFYARIQAYEVEEAEARRAEPYIRASRSIMNAVKNLYEQNHELEEYHYEESKFMQEAGRHFRQRLHIIAEVVEQIAVEPDHDHHELLNRVFSRVEEADRDFIRACAEAVASRRIHQQDVTRLLMSNRLFTQSCRMMALSLQSLNIVQRGEGNGDGAL